MTDKKPQLLKEQQDAVDAIRNTVVAAGAGSGKTTVLSFRYLNLIQKYKYNVDEILTLTFTKKATVEMSSRIYSVLKEKAPEQAANFYKANIKTLDSYCNSVAKLGSRFYGISPDFTQDEETVRTQISSKALPFLLEHRDNIAIKQFVRVQEYEKVAEELFVNPILSHSKIAQPIDFRADFNKQSEKIAAEWDRVCAHCSEVLGAIVDFENDFEGNREAKFFKTYLDIVKDNSVPETVKISMQDVLDGNYQRAVEYVKKVIPYSKLAKAGNAKGAGNFSEVVQDIRDTVDFLIPLCNFIYGVPFLRELLPLLEEFQDMAMDIKRSSNCLTFADISNMALCILRDHPEIRYLEKQKYKAIMIDEFQDNNQDQRDMLFLLAENKERMDKGVPSVDELEKEKLFFVGDEKQSIYRFRGADVEVFNNLAKDFKSGTIKMHTNHRSHPELIAAFNTIFGGERYASEEAQNVEFDAYPPSVFYTERQQNGTETEIPAYEAVYHNVLPDANKLASSPVKGKRVNLAFYYKDTEAAANCLSGTEAEAEWVARKIAEKHKIGYEYSDMAVLLKTYSNQGVFERAFLRHGIPYNTEVIKGFFSDGPVSDMVAYLRLCAYDNDRMSYIQVLCSPFVNLTVTEAEAVVSLGQEPFSDGADKVLEKSSLDRFKEAGRFYETVKAFSKENSLAKTVSMLWYEGGYRFETMWNHTVEMYGKLYDLLFELSRQADSKNMNLASFVDYVTAYSDEKSKLEVSIPLEKAEGVHIMTIHKSKGLEFKVVFVSDCQKGSKNQTNEAPIYYSDRYGFTVNTPPCKELGSVKANYFFNLAKKEISLKLSAEMRRLSYVALTRAEDEIYITGNKYAQGKNDEKYLPGGEKNCDSIYDTLAPIISFYNQTDEAGNLIYQAASPFTEIEQIEPYPRGAAFSDSGYRANTQSARKSLVRELAELGSYEKTEPIKKDEAPEIYISPSKLHGHDDETAGFKENEKNQDTYPYPKINKLMKKHKKFTAENFGTIAHAYMESAINGTDALLEAKGKFPYSNKDVIGLENDEKDLKDIDSVCREMRDKFKQDELGKKAMSSEWHKAEYEFRSRIGKKIVKGIIDLVFKDGNGSAIVVDYKTNKEIKPELYYTQLACYRQAVSQMLGINESLVRCFLYYLRFGKAIDITDECKKIDLEQSIKDLDNIQ